MECPYTWNTSLPNPLEKQWQCQRRHYPINSYVLFITVGDGLNACPEMLNEEHPMDPAVATHT